MEHLRVDGDKQVVPVWINGEDYPLNPSNYFEVIHAADGKVVHYAQEASEKDSLAAVETAAKAFPQWSATTIDHRRQVLNKVADLLEERADILGALHALETSCQPQFGKMLPKLAAPIIREVASQITFATTGTLPPDERAVIMVTKQPIGPVLIIPPWNSPSILGPRSIASALAAGCTVVLKASELCPLTYRAVCQVFVDAGVPPGALNQIVVQRENAPHITETVIAHPSIRKVEFIGSNRVGSLISEMASRHLKPSWMELGGKGPVIVRHDADLEHAVKAIAFGSFVHHGQICMSTERIIVVKQVADEFLRLLKAEVDEHWNSGVGTAATKAFADKAHDLVQSALETGAKLLAGDNAYLGPEKAGLRPTIVTGISRDAEIRDTETFGPSASVFVVDNDEEALETANESRYGLVGAIWSSDTMAGLAMAKRLECGVVHVNDCTVSDYPTMAAQGTKGSGWGTNNSYHGIQEFLSTKTISLRAASGQVQFRG